MPIESALVFDPKTRNFGIAPDFDAIIPFWLTTDPPNQQVTVPAGDKSSAYPMSYRYRGPFRGHYLFYNADRDDLLISIIDGRDGYAYTMKGMGVHLQTIASDDPGFPSILPEALVLQHRAHITVHFTNLDSTNDANIRFMIQGFAFEPTRVKTSSMRDKIAGTLDRMHFLRPHFATLDDGVATVSANSEGRFFMTIDDAGYFEVFKITAIAYQSGTLTELTSTQYNNVLIQITDYSGRQLSNSRSPDIPLALLAGRGKTPNILPARVMLPPLVQTMVDIINNNSVDVDVYLTFIGRRIFTVGVQK